MSTSWQIHPDGSFDLQAGPLALRGCYPGLDDEPVRALRVRRETTARGEAITYELAEGAFRLELERTAEGIRLNSAIRGRARAPHWARPIAGARVEGAAQLFRQGVGFSGPTGFVSLIGRTDLYSYESYLVTGLVGAGGETFAVGALAHGDFLHRCAVYNRQHRYNFRNRELTAAPIFFDTSFSTEGLALPEGGLELPPLLFRAGPDRWTTLRGLAGDIGRAHGARVGRPSYHWCSWYHRGSHLTLDELLSFLDGARELGEPLQAVQIDDGYQTFRGDWLEPNEKWPGGLERAFAEIRARGFRPGIWIGPYMVDNRSRLFREHPDWVLHDLSGQPLAAWKFHDGSVNCEEVYILDTSHPAAFAYLRQVFTTLRRWGAEFYKTDFVEWGFKDSTTVRRHTPGKTSAQYHGDVVRLIRECIGPDSYWLGCIAFYAPYLGYCDGMRVSSDTGPLWALAPFDLAQTPEGGMGNVLGETYQTLYANNQFWQNDPDALFLRTYLTRLTEEEVRGVAFFCGIAGVSVYTSDRFHELPPERLRLWRFLRPQEQPWTARPFAWGEGRQFLTLVREYPELGAWAVLHLNPGPTPETEAFDTREVLGPEESWAFAWGPEGHTPIGPRREWTVTLAAHGSALFFFSSRSEPPPPDLTLGGYRGSPTAAPTERPPSGPFGGGFSEAKPLAPVR